MYFSFRSVLYCGKHHTVCVEHDLGLWERLLFMIKQIVGSIDTNVVCRFTNSLMLMFVCF